MEKLTPFISLNTIDTMKGSLPQMVGVPEEAEDFLKKINPLIVDWQLMISVYIASLKFGEGQPILTVPRNLFTEVATSIDELFPECTLPARTIMWFVICEQLMRYAAKTAEARIQQHYNATGVTAELEKQIETELRQKTLN